MYSCKVDGKIQAEGEKQRTWVAGNIRYTEHKNTGWSAQGNSMSEM